LPLVLMGAVVWYYVSDRATQYSRREAVRAPEAAAEKPAAPPAAAVQPEAYDPGRGLDIQGSPEFKSQVTHALKLIWMADRDTFLFIRDNLGVIRNEDKTGFYRDDGRSVAAISSDQAFRSLTWCAGIIAHQSWHSWHEVNAKKKAVLTPPPPGQSADLKVEANPVRADYKGMDAIFNAEDKAAAFQLEVLRKVGAPGSETGLVLRRAPRDFSSAHDGNYALNP